jgi:cell division protein ZapA
MNDIREAGKVMGADRVAVMAALQIAQELFTAKAGGGASFGEIKRRIRHLNEIADEMLATQEKLF